MRNGEENVKVHIHKSKSSMRLQNYPSLIFFQLVSAWMMTLDVIVCHWSSWSSLSFELSLPTSFTTFTDLFFFHSSFGAALSSYFLGLFAIVITHRILDYGSCPSNFILVLSFIVLFRMSSHLNTVHNIKEIICTAFCSDDQIIVQVIASMFRIHFSFSSLFSLSLSLSFHTPNHLWIHTKF